MKRRDWVGVIVVAVAAVIGGSTFLWALVDISATAFCLNDPVCKAERTFELRREAEEFDRAYAQRMAELEAEER